MLDNIHDDVKFLLARNDNLMLMLVVVNIQKKNLTINSMLCKKNKSDHLTFRYIRQKNCEKLEMKKRRKGATLTISKKT
jgi:hypothetical protein